MTQPCDHTGVVRCPVCDWVRPLLVGGRLIPRHILHGPPGEFARYCGEVDPGVLAILDAEES